MSFEDYIKELADPMHAVSVSKLVNLSAMTPDEASYFQAIWLEMELHRRREVMQALLDLAEASVELEFVAHYFTALDDRDPDVRRLALKGLWEYQGLDLIDSLLRLLADDTDAAVRAEAALALGRFVIAAEFDAIRSTDAKRIEEALTQTIRDVAEPVEVRGRALESLGSRSFEWVRELIGEMYDSSERRMRLSAVHAMGRSCDSIWISTLISELENDDAEMRYEAAIACGSIADSEATGHLLPLLEDPDAEVQEAAIGAIGEIGDLGARETLEELLIDGDERVIEAVSAALAELDLVEDPLGVKLSGQSERQQSDD